MRFSVRGILICGLPLVRAHLKKELSSDRTGGKQLRRASELLPNIAPSDEVGIQGIVGGSFASSGEFPAFAALYSSSANTFYCGGTLIAANKVLTAAHCLVGSSGTTCPDLVVIGPTTVDYTAGTTDGEVFGISSCVAHSSYSATSGGLYADVAVITLSTSSTATPVTLNQDMNFPCTEGQDMEVIGFGGTLANTGTDDAVSQVYSTELKKLTTAFQDMSTCIALGNFDVNSEEHICGEVANQGDCQGDSGGPLFADNCGTTVQVGVVSFGRGCAQNDSRDYYANVANYYSWISAQAGGLSSRFDALSLIRSGISKVRHWFGN